MSDSVDSKSHTSSESRGENEIGIGPLLPPGIKLGPYANDDDADDDVIGPSLPTHLKAEADINAGQLLREIGPSMPPHLIKKLSSESNADDDNDNTFGPVLPPGFNKPDKKILGPQLPPGFKK